MNVVVFSHELPWPTNHGGRIDLYNRLRAFKELNHNVFLVCWALFEDNKSEGSFNHVRNLIDELVCFSRKNNFYNFILDKSIKLLKLTYQPNLVTQCSLQKKSFIKLSTQIHNFKADAIFVDNIYAAKLAYKFAEYINLPVFIRSHNVEHVYIKKMATVAKSFKTKLHFLAMSANLKKYEMHMLQRADAFFDISLSDLAFRRQQGLNNGYWMPPVYYNNDKIQENGHASNLLFDVAYIGNLNSPNNIQALFWFFEEVFPGIKNHFPEIRMLVAGSKPVQILVDYCSQKTNITLLPNPNDVRSLYLHSKVLINPTLVGSGVNIKTIEMLHTDNPVVCTPKAVEGLPEEMESAFDLAKNAEQFALQILRNLQNPNTSQSSRAKVRAYFEPDYLAGNIQIMENICLRKNNR